MKFLASIIFIFSTSSLFAQNNNNLDKHSQKALTQTMELLKDRNKRSKAINENKRAKDNHSSIQSLTGGDQKQTDDIYNLSADIMNTLVQQSGGDPNKMMELMNKAQQDPKAFAESFTPAQREALRKISSDIQKNKKMEGLIKTSGSIML